MSDSLAHHAPHKRRVWPGTLIVVGAIAFISGVSNALMLTGSLYMMEVYDRVLPARSIPTLVGLSALVLMLLGFQALLDLLRSRILTRIGEAVDAQLSRQMFEAIVTLPLRARISGDGLQPLRDLDQIRAFLGAGGPAALFDLPWIPLYLGICFVLHPWVGVTALAGALVLIAITIMTDVLTRNPAQVAARAALARGSLAAVGRRNAEVLRAMGMASRLYRQWESASREHISGHRRASDVTGGLGAIARALRIALQSIILGVGAWLTIRQEATAGIMIASSILTGRALAPVDLAIANWRGLIAARQGWIRIARLLKLLRQQANTPMALPAPKQSLTLEGVTLSPPGTPKHVVQEVSLSLRAGQALGVIGPSGSGKSSLVRALVGAWATTRGKVQLDGAALEQWSPEALGDHIGYLPQDIELFDSTIAENIARLQQHASPDAVIAAARAASVHDLIVSLPDGYDTRIGEGGQVLSAGQRQRVALARALYGQPFLVVLDEPSSSLDAEGEEALTKAILGVRHRGGIVVVVAHRPAALAGVDVVLAMAGGRAQAIGPRDEILKRVLRPQTSANPALKVVVDAPATVSGGGR